jgi:hypothetical protein
MKTRFLFVLCTLASLLASTAAHAQRPRRESAITINRGSMTIEPFAGYLVTQRFIDGPLGSGLGASASPVFGASISLPLAPSSSIIGTAGYSSGDLEVGLPVLGGIDVGNITSWVFDASVELRASSMSSGAMRFVPFVQLGGGAIRREVGIAGVQARSTDFTVSGGVGVNIPLSASSDIRILAKDYYGKVDFGDLVLFDAKTEDFHTLGLTAGIRLGF